MGNCIWKVATEDRLCKYCSYLDGCDARPLRDCSVYAKKYCDVMSGILGRDVMMASRKDDIVWGRKMVAFQLSRDGFMVSQIAGSLGQTHSTVLHSIKGVTEMLHTPVMYDTEIRIWQKFIETLNLQKTIVIC